MVVRALSLPHPLILTPQEWLEHPSEVVSVGDKVVVQVLEVEDEKGG